MVIFVAGFIAVQFVFVLLYLRAYALRDMLRLTAHEKPKTREEIQAFLLTACVGLISIAIAVLGGEETVSWAGYAYLLIIPTLWTHGHLMDSRRRRDSSARS